VSAVPSLVPMAVEKKPESGAPARLGGFLLMLYSRRWSRTFFLSANRSGRPRTSALGARALSDAQTGNIAGAEAEIGRLQSLEDKLKDNETYWANQVEVQRLAAAGILAHTRGDDKKAVALVRAASDLDATMDKHPATPSSGLPARELLADLLLALGLRSPETAPENIFMKPSCSSRSD
jgi:hypothetical protein